MLFLLRNSAGLHRMIARVHGSARFGLVRRTTPSCIWEWPRCASVISVYYVQWLIYRAVNFGTS